MDDVLNDNLDTVVDPATGDPTSEDSMAAIEALEEVINGDDDGDDDAADDDSE